MSGRESDKALSYLQQLDAARCNSQWSSVPELARKVEKHSPRRADLTRVARAEAQLATSSTLKDSEPLEEIVNRTPEGASALSDEQIQATVCLAWASWIKKDNDRAIAWLSFPLADMIRARFGSEKKTVQWTHVCLIKAAFIKAACEAAAGKQDAATNSSSTMVKALPPLSSLSGNKNDFLYWTEQLAALRSSLLAHVVASPHASLDSSAAVLQAFRFWSQLVGQTGSLKTASGPLAHTANVPRRRQIWRLYFLSLSKFLHDGLLYTPVESGTVREPVAATHARKWTGSELQRARTRQWTELRQVATTYEQFLLSETGFPKANEENAEVEEWVEVVVRNWEHLSGPSWQEQHFGQGGLNSLSRDVLDVLYRSATKTFHSTQILRHLFTLHASLAEFDLAFNAFDTYVELTSKAKARAEKGGSTDGPLDNDDHVIGTIAHAIDLLCQYGAHDQAEKAHGLGNLLVDLLEKSGIGETPDVDISNGDASRTGILDVRGVTNETRADAYRAVGISRAQWARFTENGAARIRLRDEGIEFLTRAADLKTRGSYAIPIAFSLALLLGENGEIEEALKVVRRALTTKTLDDIDSTSEDSDESSQEGIFAIERQKLPIWHLLALLLTTKSEFGNAVKACDAALDQFGDLETLFGTIGPNNASVARRSSDAEREKAGSSITNNSGSVVSLMSYHERAALIQIKLTRVALVELLDGPDQAVEFCEELLSTFSRTFDGSEPKAPPQPEPASQDVLQRKSRADGSTRSSSGSIFRRSLSSKRKSGRYVSAAGKPPSSAGATVVSSEVLKAQQSVRNKGNSNEAKGEKRLSKLVLPHPFQASRERIAKEMGEDSEVGSTQFETQFEKETQRAIDELQAAISNEKQDVPPDGLDGRSSTDNPQAMSNSPIQPVHKEVRNLLVDEQPPAAGATEQAPHQDIRLPAPFPHPARFPYPHFPSNRTRIQRSSLLVQIWLFIASLYQSVGSIEEAEDAVTEAESLTAAVEIDVVQETSSARALATPDWGCPQSVEDLWADVWSKRAEIAIASTRPHQAISHYEAALSHYQNHAASIIGLSNLLLDIYSQKIPSEVAAVASSATGQSLASPEVITATSEAGPHTHIVDGPRHSLKGMPTPEELNRLAARDRAYGLLSTLTELGTGWNNAEAWLTLARAHEDSGEIEKAKEALWWTVELEDRKPLRVWSCIGSNGYVLP